MSTRFAKITEEEWEIIQKSRRKKVHKYLRGQKIAHLTRLIHERLEDWGRPVLQRMFGGASIFGGLVVCYLMYGQPDSGEVMFSALVAMASGAYAFCSRRKIFA